VGCPDLVFAKARVLVFCDGDFWHGRSLRKRIAKLQTGSNSAYWVAKIQGNVKRDRRVTRELRRDGWNVLRFWEKDILADVERVAETITVALRRTAE
jgi:DNA mismatch endonuclease (patch repair protein)